MWFNPDELVGSTIAPPANLANLRISTHEESSTNQKISKLAELAEGIRDNNTEGSEYTETEADKPRAVACYTPNGKSILVLARDAEHAKWLRNMNKIFVKENGK